MLLIRERQTESQELNLCGFTGKRKEGSKPNAGAGGWRSQKEGEFSKIRGQQAVTYRPDPACLWFYVPFT